MSAHLRAKQLEDQIRIAVGRPEPGEEEKAPFRGKPAALMSASPGGFGGFRGLMNLASILGSMGMMALPDYVIVGMAPQAFNGDGRLVQQRQRDALAQMISRHVRWPPCCPQPIGWRD